MAFNLKKVLKALLLSSNQPLSIKDVQAAFTRFHDTATLPTVVTDDPPSPEASARQAGDAVSSEATAETGAEAPAMSEGVNEDRALMGAATGQPAAEPAEVVAEVVQDPELYSDVPSLVTAAQIREAMDEIAADLRNANDGILLIEGNAGYRIVTHPSVARWVRILRQEPPPVKLSQSSVETLAVIAYRQPVTRTEIETIRGVSAEAGITKLLERDLIYVVGRADTPGRPTQFGTTEQFLEFVGAKSLDELPASDVLSSRQIDEWLKNSSTAHQPNDTDMGLADEELPLEGPGSASAATATTEAPPAASA